MDIKVSGMTSARVLAVLVLCVCFINQLFANSFSASYIKQEPIQPIPLSVAYSKAKADLGKRLFFDPRLSKDNTISCGSCHMLNRAGVDLKSLSNGVGGQFGMRNTPTVFNAVFNSSQFWDGRALDLKDQVKGPITNPLEMGMPSMAALVEKLSTLPSYVVAFKTVYEQPINEDNIADAIAEYEKTLITPGARFDEYLRGRTNAISRRARKGYELFQSYGCIECHNGVNVGGSEFKRFGVMYTPDKRILDNDMGRYDVTGKEEDKRVFRVPSLRLVAYTPPYFHNGSVRTLRDAIKIMMQVQLGQEAVPESDLFAIEAFLRTLAGPIEQ